MSEDRPSSPEGTDALLQTARESSGKGLPPVHLWDPPLSGDMDMRIARDGTWFHEGAVIKRDALVRLFASILKREGNEHFLVTPVEKWRIEVEDAPFVAMDFEVEDAEEGPVLVFETNTGDRVRAGPGHPIAVETDPGTGEPSPYVEVRHGLRALIDRKSFYRLVELAEEEGGRAVVRSGGETFAVGPAG